MHIVNWSQVPGLLFDPARPFSGWVSGFLLVVADNCWASRLWARLGREPGHVGQKPPQLRAPSALPCTRWARSWRTAFRAGTAAGW